MKFLYALSRLPTLIVVRYLYGSRVEGVENVPHGGVLFVANHASFLDPPVIGCCVPFELEYLARSTLFTGFWGRYLRAINAHPIDRDSGDLAATRNIIRLLKEGRRVLLFPEGTRTPDGNLQPAQPGAGFIAGKAQVPIIPVKVFGTYEAWPRTRKWPKLPGTTGRFGVVLGKPFFAPERISGKEGYRELADQMMRAIGDMMPPQGL